MIFHTPTRAHLKNQIALYGEQTLDLSKFPLITCENYEEAKKQGETDSIITYVKDIHPHSRVTIDGCPYTVYSISRYQADLIRGLTLPSANSVVYLRVVTGCTIIQDINDFTQASILPEWFPQYLLSHERLEVYICLFDLSSPDPVLSGTFGILPPEFRRESIKVRTGIYIEPYPCVTHNGKNIVSQEAKRKGYVLMDELTQNTTPRGIISKKGVSVVLDPMGDAFGGLIISSETAHKFKLTLNDIIYLAGESTPGIYVIHPDPFLFPCWAEIRITIEGETPAIFEWQIADLSSRAKRAKNRNKVIVPDLEIEYRGSHWYFDEPDDRSPEYGTLMPIK